MFNWLKTNTDNSRQQSVNGKLVNSTISFGDTITNIINIPKKILFGVALLLVILLTTVLWWRGNFSFQSVTNNQNISGNTVGGNLTINQGIPLEQLIELSKKFGVVEKERDDWIRKYQDLEKQLASRTDDIAKQAKAFLDKGDLEQAEKLFVQVLENELKQAKAANLKAAENAISLAQIKELQYNTAEAINYYQQSVQLNPDNTDGWNRLGNLLDRIGEIDKAIISYQTVLKLGQNHQDQQEIEMAYVNLGNVYRRLGELNKAFKMYEKSLNSTDAQTKAIGYSNMGLLYDTLGDLDKSFEMQIKSLEINQSLDRKEGIAVNYTNLGYIYHIRGDLNKAIEMYSKSLQISKIINNKESIAVK